MSTLPGKFVWFEHSSADTAKAGKFYTELFGWHIEATPMGGPEPYPLIMNGNQGIGGLRPLESGTAAHWMSYLSVDDVDASHKAALGAGAKSSMPPTDFGPVGRGAGLIDPTGAHFSVWKGSDGDAADDDTTPVGGWHWNELATNDEKKALAFYEKVFGYSHDAMDMGPHGTYYVFKKGDKARAGLMRAPIPEAPSMWVPYVAVADCDACVAKAQKLGAKLVAPASDAPGVGRFAVFIDPQGAALGVITPAS
jgi:predicted enzyme related to lactoylglutathione lyase